MPDVPYAWCSTFSRPFVLSDVDRAKTLFIEAGGCNGPCPRLPSLHNFALSHAPFPAETEMEHRSSLLDDIDKIVWSAVGAILDSSFYSSKKVSKSQPIPSSKPKLLSGL